jgi:hypothetical protein
LTSTILPFKVEQLSSVRFRGVNWKHLNLEQKFTNSFSVVFKELLIKKIRFKPGYSSLWRKARAHLQTDLKKKFQYQHSLTKFLLKFYKFKYLKVFFFSELKLSNVLLKAKFFPDPTTTELFFNNSLIYLNGTLCSNYDVSIVIGDFVQLVIHQKYYIMHKWLIDFFNQKKLRLKNKIHTKLMKRYNAPLYKQKSSTLPAWLLHHRISFFDVPPYLEVDYFTLSFVYLYEPFFWNDIDPDYFFHTRLAVINMYNWKYLN